MYRLAWINLGPWQQVGRSDIRSLWYLTRLTNCNHCLLE